MDDPQRKNIDLTKQLKRELRVMAAKVDKDLKTFIQDLLAVLVEHEGSDHVNWVVKKIKQKP